MCRAQLWIVRKAQREKTKNTAVNIQTEKFKSNELRWRRDDDDDDADDIESSCSWRIGCGQSPFTMQNEKRKTKSENCPSNFFSFEFKKSRSAFHFIWMTHRIIARLSYIFVFAYIVQLIGFRFCLPICYFETMAILESIWMTFKYTSKYLHVVHVHLWSQ